MSAKRIVEYLRELCTDIDAGRQPRRFSLGKALAPLVVPAAFGLALGGAAGCGTAAHHERGEEICDNGVDDDDDARIDCSDPDCDGDEACGSVTLYMAPFEGICDDGVDNDSDGYTDCADVDCESVSACQEGPAEVCDDGVDNDSDGYTDCADDECREETYCTALPPYGIPWGIPWEDCTNGVDDDYDGLADCDDGEDCAGSEACMPVPGYAVPFEADCSDGADDDLDGLTDCDDGDCTEDPACMDVPLYSAPF